MFGHVARVAVLISLGGMFVVGCGPFGPSPPTLCDPAQRTELIKVVLVELQPSPAFTLKGGSTGWIQVTRLPGTAGGLFGDIGPVAEVHPVRSGVAPNLKTDANGFVESHDPAINIDKGLTWQPLPMGSGDWQLYSLEDPGIEVVSCPA